MSTHSPLGASGAHRWMACPASVALAAGVADAESEHAQLGTAAHYLAAQCLETGGDAWEYVGYRFVDGSLMYNYEEQAPWALPVDKDMADAVQVYLDAVRLTHLDRHQGNSWVEQHFRCPDLHDLFYGTADFVHLDGATLHVWDYKHGAGVVVEVERNPQLMYYAVGALGDLILWDQVDEVVLHVAQPRGWHPAGQVREWRVSTLDLIAWLHEDLLPAMDLAAATVGDLPSPGSEAWGAVAAEWLADGSLTSGEHCRFCPARFRACPRLRADVKRLEEIMTKVTEVGAPELTAEELAEGLNLGQLFKIVNKAMLEVATARLEHGQEVPGWKLVAARANRVFRDGADAAAVDKFGRKRAYTTPVLKSPAEIDRLPGGKEFTEEWAHKPDAGLTVAPASDNRQARGPKRESMFQPVKGTTKRRK